MSSRLAGAALAAALFLATAILVAAGVFHGFDQYAVRHWMPWIGPGRSPLLSWQTFVPRLRPPVAEAALKLWVWPASVLVSLAVVVAAARRVGVRILVLWLVVDVVELAGKLAVERPALTTSDGGHVAGFDHSLPSGHTLRAFVVATALACVWRRGRLGFLWAATVPFALVVGGDHVPTDVVASLFAFAACAAVVRPWAGTAAGAAAASAPAASSRRARRRSGRGAPPAGP